MLHVFQLIIGCVEKRINIITCAYTSFWIGLRELYSLHYTTVGVDSRLDIPMLVGGGQSATVLEGLWGVPLA